MNKKPKEKEEFDLFFSKKLANSRSRDIPPTKPLFIIDPNGNQIEYNLAVPKGVKTQCKLDDLVYVGKLIK